MVGEFVEMVKKCGISNPPLQWEDLRLEGKKGF